MCFDAYHSHDMVVYNMRQSWRDRLTLGIKLIGDSQNLIFKLQNTLAFNSNDRQNRIRPYFLIKEEYKDELTCCLCATKNMSLTG